MVERLKALCAQRNTNFKRLERELGLGNATLVKASPTMGCGRLKLLADYFHVSMEYLMTGSDPDPAARPIYPDLSLDALELARAYMNLSPELKNAVRRTAGLDDIKEKEGLKQA